MGLVIIVFPAVLRPLLDQLFPGFNLVTGAQASPYAYLTSVLTHGFASMVVLAVPMILGLTWNKWAGGESYDLVQSTTDETLNSQLSFFTF